MQLNEYGRLRKFFTCWKRLKRIASQTKEAAYTKKINRTVFSDDLPQKLLKQFEQPPTVSHARWERIDPIHGQQCAKVLAKLERRRKSRSLPLPNDDV
ncbi:unnamed protein product [Auanema sp. JU1783]|nr:unnamed protein product [Auanema sp. JU1783]